MRNFLIGFVVAAVVIIGGVYLYARLGFVSPRADIPVSSFEANQAMAILDRSIDRRAPETKNPMPPDEANLTAGMKLFQSNCAGCHGDITHPDSPLSEAFYPRAPQFVHDAPDMEENQNFYLIKHGIRWSGMPAWERQMTDQQIWQVVTFLSHMDKLSPQLQEQWKAQSKGMLSQ